MVLRLLIACLLIAGTTLVHAVYTAVTVSWIRSFAERHKGLRNHWTRAALLSLLVLGMSLTASLEAALWALGYWLLGALPNFSEAFYFSLVTFTTLGYGDVTLSEEWRLLGALEAANGIVMFGWTTALITNVARHLFFRDLPSRDS